MVCRFTPDMKINYANPSFYRTFKVNASEILGVDVMDLIPEEDRRRVRKYMDALSPSRQNCFFKHYVVLDDGTKLCVEWDYHGIFDNDGSIMEYQAVGRVNKCESDGCGC